MASNIDSDLLKLYLEIAGDAYGYSFPSDVSSPNHLRTGWQKLNLYMSNDITSLDYYDFNNNGGFDAAIYYNSCNGEVCRLG